MVWLTLSSVPSPLKSTVCRESPLISNATASLYLIGCRGKNVNLTSTDCWGARTQASKSCTSQTLGWYKHSMLKTQTSVFELPGEFGLNPPTVYSTLPTQSNYALEGGQLYTTRCFIERRLFSFFCNSVKWWSIYTKFLPDVAEEIEIQNICTKYGC